MNNIRSILYFLAVTSTTIAAEVQTTSLTPQVPAIKEASPENKLIVEKWKNRLEAISTLKTAEPNSSTESNWKADYEFILEQSGITTISLKVLTTEEKDNLDKITQFFKSKSHKQSKKSDTFQKRNHNFGEVIQQINGFLTKYDFSRQDDVEVKSLLLKATKLCDDKINAYGIILKYITDTLQTPIQTEISKLLIAKINKIVSRSDTHGIVTKDLMKVVTFDRNQMIDKYQKKFQKWSTRKLYLTN